MRAPVTRYGGAAGNMRINLRRKRLHLMYFYLSPLSPDDTSTVYGLPVVRTRVRTSAHLRARSVHRPVRLPLGEHVKSYYSDKLRRTDLRGPFSRRIRGAMELSHTYIYGNFVNVRLREDRPFSPGCRKDFLPDR